MPVVADMVVHDERLLLRAEEAGDLPLISALLQDAILLADQAVWQPRAHRLVLMLNRFRWEHAGATRVSSALRFDHVLHVARRHWPDANAHDPGATVLELLAFTVEDSVATLHFAGAATLRLTIECVEITLEDLSAPWTTQSQPAHNN
jgi:hypothetical protein